MLGVLLGGLGFAALLAPPLLVVLARVERASQPIQRSHVARGRRGRPGRR